MKTWRTLWVPMGQVEGYLNNGERGGWTLYSCFPLTNENTPGFCLIWWKVE